MSDADDTTSGGVILTDSAKEKPSTGKVVAVGPGMNGEAVNAKAGSIVLYSKFSGIELEVCFPRPTMRGGYLVRGRNNVSPIPGLRSVYCGTSIGRVMMARSISLFAKQMS